ncbi:MAG: hypothetical protein UFA98_06415 [Ruminococcus sp.]|nr:hypothetical protein [Ruminococcus sp.]
MNLEMIRNEYEAKQKKLIDELHKHIKFAVNYDELIERCESIEDIDKDGELEWNDTQDQRGYDILNRELWMVENIISMIDETNGINGDKKKQHRANKSIEEFITSLRYMKKENNEIIEREQRTIDDINAAIGVLVEMRGK